MFGLVQKKGKVHVAVPGRRGSERRSFAESAVTPSRANAGGRISGHPRRIRVIGTHHSLLNRKCLAGHRLGIIMFALHVLAVDHTTW